MRLISKAIAKMLSVEVCQSAAHSSTAGVAAISSG